MRLLIAILLFSASAQAQQVAKTWVTPAGWTAGVLEYRPPNVGSLPRKPALIIYSHGNGEATDYNNAGALAAANGLDNNEIPVLLTGGTHFTFQEGGTGPERSFVVLSFARNTSQSPFFESASNQYVDWALKYMRDSLANIVDTFRIYLVGISGGGAVGWNFPGRSIADAQKIAAVVQVCPTNEFATWCNIAGGNLPIWAFHAQNDPTTSADGTQGSINAINACGISTAPIFTNPATGGHSIWPTYLDTNYVGSNGMNVYEWMLQYTRNPDEIETFPPDTLLNISTQQVFDLVQGVKPVHQLFDGDESTVVFPNFFDGYITEQHYTRGIWVDLEKYINHPKIAVRNINNGGLTVYFRFVYDWTDTTRYSDWFSTTLPNDEAGWKFVDSANSRAYSDSARFLEIRIPDVSANGFSEIRVYGHGLGAAPSIYPDPEAVPDDPGKFFMGHGKLFVDTTMDDASNIMRIQNDMSYIDTPVVTWVDGKYIMDNRYDNSTNITYLPAQRAGREMWPYFSNIRPAFERIPGNVQRKDIPIGADSTDPASWQYVYNTHYGIAGKFGRNTSADLTGYTFGNTNPGVGQGYFKRIEIGNEDAQHWSGPEKFHDVLSQLLKIKAGYDGAKAADPSIEVISGALTGIRIDRLRAMYLANLFRFQSKSYPCNSLAINEYATSAGGQHGSSPPYDGITPEEFQLGNKLDTLNKVRNKMFPGRKIYITEIGYDASNYYPLEESPWIDTVDHNSNYNVPDISGQNRELTKAYWFSRTEEIAADSLYQIHAVMQYTQTDIPGGDFGSTGFAYVIELPMPGNQLHDSLHKFMSPGILSGGGFTSLPKTMYWFKATRKYRFENYKAWNRHLVDGDSTGVHLRRYRHNTDANKFIYSVYRGTRDNSTTSNYQFNVPGVQSAVLVTPTIFDKDGVETVLNVTGNTITVPTVNEGAQYILVTTSDEEPENQSPTAAAGTDQTITLPTSQVTVNGSSSSDPDGTISTYLWTKISGPATFTITNANISSTTITGLVQGTYVFRLTVTDNDSATDTDDITITVNAAPVIRDSFRGSLKNKFRN